MWRKKHAIKIKYTSTLRGQFVTSLYWEYVVTRVSFLCYDILLCYTYKIQFMIAIIVPVHFLEIATSTRSKKQFHLNTTDGQIDSCIRLRSKSGEAYRRKSTMQHQRISTWMKKWPIWSHAITIVAE